YFDSTGGFDAAGFAAALGDTSRSLLGTEQHDWLAGQLAASTATWQVLGQQVLMARMDIPAPVALQAIGFSDYAALLAKAQVAPETLTAEEAAILAQPAIPYNLDAWDGYPVDRERVLGAARSLNRNLVVLAGDTHNAWASELRDANGDAVAVEFATASVSSPGLEEVLPGEDPAALAAGLVQLIEPLKYAETSLRGFLELTVSPNECRGTWHFIDTVKTRDYALVTGSALKTTAGAARLEPV
ncbi:MAG: alkaline phosphatase D family protein, partial [Rhodocyclaceae bacterium]|nr:alkaline phosphatase D family protein [Rhodocyclaceae bacterium]